MSHKYLMGLTIVILLFGLSLGVQADVVFLDDFDGNSLNTTVWRELAQNASGLNESVSGGQLVVEDINDPWTINNTSGGTWALVTLFSQDFDSPLFDFTVEFKFSWSSDDPDTGMQSEKAMQGIYIAAYDTEAAQIARVGYSDDWVGNSGGKAGKIRGGDEINAGQHRLESSGSATISISRTGNDVVVTWDGVPLMSGTNAEPLQSIGILFYYYAYDGVGGPSFFGTESVDLVQVAETVDDITTTTTTTTSCDEPCGNICCLEDEYCCNGECCSLGRVCCEDGHCCDPDSICCGGGCCHLSYLCVMGTCITIACPFNNLYGENSEEVTLLRNYRDEVLDKTPVGQEIIRLYYLWTPAIVKAMEEDEAFREQLKEMIDGILPLIREEVE